MYMVENGGLLTWEFCQELFTPRVIHYTGQSQSVILLNDIC